MISTLLKNSSKFIPLLNPKFITICLFDIFFMLLFATSGNKFNLFLFLTLVKVFLLCLGATGDFTPLLFLND